MMYIVCNNLVGMYFDEPTLKRRIRHGKGYKKIYRFALKGYKKIYRFALKYQIFPIYVCHVFSDTNLV